MRLSLSDGESIKIQKKIKIRLKNYINVIVIMSKNSRFELKYSKKGAKNLNNYKGELSRFIIDTINFINIKAVRTEADSNRVINSLINNKLSFLAEDQEYADAMKTINRKEQEVLNEISGSTEISLKTFLPEVKSVEISFERYMSRYYKGNYNKSFNIKIDDGVNTDLQYKGDGIKSLTALALFANHDKSTSTSIIAIEEPEAHLHPGAIHSLNDILRSISNTTQLLITTHNPLFIARNSLSSNIIVSDNSAHIAKNVGELREELGVHPSDNLINAELVLLVEGESDVKIFNALMRYHSLEITKALDDNRLIIKAVHGASKITQDLYYYKSMMCQVFVILDYDVAGINAINSAKEKNYLIDKEYYFIRNDSNSYCEIEWC